MKILTISDLHGQLPDINFSQEFDLAIFCGDLAPNWSHHWNSDWPYQANWFRDKFNPWLEQIPAHRKIVTFGNHDSDKQLPMFIDIIQKVPACSVHAHETVIVNDKKLFVSAYSHADEFLNSNGRWGFAGTEFELETLYELIPKDIDILVTHGPPFGVLDTTYWSSGLNNIGSKALQRLIPSLKNLKLHIFGHDHCQGGMKFKSLNGGPIFVNTAKHFMELSI